MARLPGRPIIMASPRSARVACTPWAVHRVCGLSEEGSTTSSAPILAATSRRIGEKSDAITGPSPLAFSAAITASPTGPQPTTSAALSLSIDDMASAWAPTAKGSVIAA